MAATTWPLWQVDAFASRPFEGNPAAVCVLDSWPDVELMQKVAAENNLSETAFVVAEGDRWGLRWFTPVIEVALCGHATLASAFVLQTELSEPGPWVFETQKAGTLTARAGDDGLVMDFPAEPVEAMDVPAALSEALGKAPLRAAVTLDSTRALKWLAEYETADDVVSLRPDMASLAALPAERVLATAPGRDVDFVSRYFAPRAGVDEDPVTGSAHCLLAPYWAPRLGRSTLSARQVGPRGGEVGCEVAGDRVLLSGQARLFLRGHITV